MASTRSPLLLTWLYSDMASTPSSFASLSMLTASLPLLSAGEIAERTTRSLVSGARWLIVRLTSLRRTLNLRYKHTVYVEGSGDHDEGDRPPAVRPTSAPCTGAARSRCAHPGGRPDPRPRARVVREPRRVVRSDRAVLRPGRGGIPPAEQSGSGSRPRRSGRIRRPGRSGDPPRRRGLRLRIRCVGRVRGRP